MLAALAARISRYYRGQPDETIDWDAVASSGAAELPIGVSVEFFLPVNCPNCSAGVGLTPAPEGEPPA